MKAGLAALRVVRPSVRMRAYAADYSSLIPVVSLVYRFSYGFSDAR